MRSGGSVLKAAGPFTYWGTAEGVLPREHGPRAGCTERCREHRPQPAVQNLREHRPQAVANKLHMGTEKALRDTGEPFLYVLELAKLNLTA